MSMLKFVCISMYIYEYIYIKIYSICICFCFIEIIEIWVGFFLVVNWVKGKINCILVFIFS